MRSYVHYESYDKAIERMKTPEQKYKLYRIITDYGLYGKEPEYTGDDLVDMALEFIIPLITSANKRKEIAKNNGTYGGAPKGNQNAKKQPKTTKNNQETTKNNQETTKNKLNVNVNVNDNSNMNGNINGNENENVNVNVKEKEELNPFFDINKCEITDWAEYDKWNREHGIVEEW